MAAPLAPVEDRALRKFRRNSRASDDLCVHSAEVGLRHETMKHFRAPEMPEEPTVPPDLEPEPPVQEPPDPPVSEPDAPVREPDPEGPRRLVSRERYTARANTTVQSSGCSLPPIQSSTLAMMMSLMRASDSSRFNCTSSVRRSTPNSPNSFSGSVMPSL